MTARTYSAELRLVFAVAHPSVSPSALQALLPEVRDWSRMLGIAEREGAVPTLWRALKPLAAHPPEPAVSFLQARSALQDFRMAQLATRAAEAVRQLDARGVPVLLLKGAAIGAVVDPSFRARPMTDVDLLVHAEHLGAAREALAAAGWEQSRDTRLHRLLADMHHEAPFYDPKLPGVRLELHTAVLPPDHSFAFTADTLWTSAHEAKAPFSGALVPSSELMVLHAAIHFAWQHQMTFGAWRTLRGVTLLASQPGFDWSLLMHEARQRRAASSLHWTLRLARALGALHVPQEVLTGTRPPTPRFVEGAIERQVLASVAPGEFPASPSETVSRWLWLAAIRPKWSGHAHAGRLDPERRWDRTMGKAIDESRLTQVRRHSAAYRTWAQFVLRTLLGR